MDKGHQKELQLLPPPPPPPLPPSTTMPTALTWLHHHHHHRRRHLHSEPPSLDLKLSMSLERPVGVADEGGGGACIESLKWHTAEQIRLAAIEKAYAERVRELSRREIEMAQSEFSRARAVWATAREDMARVERLRDSAITSFMGRDITCHSCRQRFRPYEN